LSRTLSIVADAVSVSPPRPAATIVLLFPVQHAGQFDPERGIGHDVVEPALDLGHGHDRRGHARPPLPDGVGERSHA
jgi:hypothetical protein